MRKLLLSIFTLMVSVTVWAQNSAVTNAILYHRDGDISKAKQEIDQASGHEKTKEQSKTWCYKGMIYQDIANSLKPEVKSLDPEALSVAYQSYEKAIQLDPGKGEYYKIASEKIKELWASFINKGAQEYEAKQFKKAQQSFEAAQNIKPSDTTAYVYALYSADELGDDAAVKKYIDALSKLNHKSVSLYYKQITITKKLEGLDKAIAVADKAVVDYPGNTSLVQLQTNLYLEAGKDQQAIDNIQKLLNDKPHDAGLHTQMGILYANLKQKDKAIESYKKAISIDPGNFVSNYNAAVIYFDQAKEKYDELHRLSVSEYQKTGKAKEAELSTLTSKATDHAKVAMAVAQDETDKQQLQVLINECTKLNKK